MAGGLRLGVCGFALLCLGLFLRPLVPNVSLEQQLVVIVLGVQLVVVGEILAVMTLYRPTLANQAFVRTGWGGPHVALDFGAVVIPSLHGVVPVSLEEVTWEFALERPGAPLSSDGRWLSLSARATVQVELTHEGVLNAARKLGTRTLDAARLGAILGEAAGGTLREAASRREYRELAANRGAYARAASDLLAERLGPTGLKLRDLQLMLLGAPAQAIAPTSTAALWQGEPSVNPGSEAPTGGGGWSGVRDAEGRTRRTTGTESVLEEASQDASGGFNDG